MMRCLIKLDSKVFTSIAVAAFLILPLILFLFTKDSFAQSRFSIEVSPAKINRVIDPGRSITQTFRVGNYSGEDQTVYLYARDFTVNSETGGLTFYENDNLSGAGRYSLSKWVSIPYSSVRVPNGSVQEVDVTISVPADAEAGGHYAAVFFQSQDPERIKDGTSIGSVGRIATLLLISVPGDVDTKLSLEKYFADKKIYWDSNPQVKIISLIRNNGNVHVMPTGVIFVTGGINFKDTNVLFNQKQIAILPDTPPREITETLNVQSEGLIPPMGKIKTDFMGRYGNQDFIGELSGTMSFWLIPIKFLLLVLFMLLLALFVIWRVIVSFKKEKPRYKQAKYSSKGTYKEPTSI